MFIFNTSNYASYHANEEEKLIWTEGKIFLGEASEGYKNW